MNKVKIFMRCFLVLFLALGVMAPTLWAAGEFKITSQEWEKNKKLMDDPRPVLTTTLAYKKVLPPDLYAKLTHNVEEMKNLWAECVGFRAPNEVGKIAPEIKPGTYSYKDKAKYPGLKELMIPMSYEFFKEGGPPLAGSYAEIKVVPTRQYYWALPIAKATKEGIGRVQVDNNGIIKEETWSGGLPFPRPEGPFKANQVIYNWIKTPLWWENMYATSVNKGFTRTLRVDQEMVADVMQLKLKGRVHMEPYGWYDDRAKSNGEFSQMNFFYMAPRDMYGNVIGVTGYLAPEKYDQMLIYINALRRVRVLSATDIQDAIGGADYAYVDNNGLGQKLSTTIFPYKNEIVAEREYLVPFSTWDGSEYMNAKGEVYNLEWERRPTYVVKMTQLDKNFVYSYRMCYVDKETGILYHVENYDQKGRLYRSTRGQRPFIPEFGMFGFGCGIANDHLDLHTSWTNGYVVPGTWLTRADVSMRGLVVKGK
jgi:hypothetical protein